VTAPIAFPGSALSAALQVPAAGSAVTIWSQDALW
jgi:hypothetical protein